MSARPDVTMFAEAHYWRDAGDWQLDDSTKWLDRRTRLLAIGSCFASNFSRWISLHGVVVLRPGWGFHYNPVAIRDELLAALGLAKPFKVVWEDCASAASPRFLDPLRHTIVAGSRKELQEMTAEIDESARLAVHAADSILITLGLSEVWEQKRPDGAWSPLNITPWPAVFDRSIHRVRVLTVSELRDCLVEIMAAIRDVRGSIPVVLTVSPIPLKATFRPDDVRVANVRSKAVLLAAVHEARERLGDASFSYFPAYELFWANAHADGLWQGDGRHPTAASIEAACRQFVRAYARDSSEFAGPVDFQVKAVE